MLPAGHELDRKVGEVIFGWEDIGYYGPPAPGSIHSGENSVKYDTEKEANEAYYTYYVSTRPGEDWYNKKTRFCYGLSYRDNGRYPLRLPEFSKEDGSWVTNDDCILCDAWLVIEKMRSLGFCPALVGDDVDWLVAFRKGQVFASAHHESISVAICNAALYALEA